MANVLDIRAVARKKSFPLAFEVRGSDLFAYRRPIQPLTAATVEYYAQAARPQISAPDLAAQGLELIPIQFRMGESVVGHAPEGQQATSLSWHQFRALYEAVGSGSGWWPLSDEKFDEQTFFGNKEMYMLRKQDKPIGFLCLERNYEGQAHHAGIVFMGVVPSQQGKGYGKLLFEHGMEKAWQGDTQCVELSTMPAYDQMTGKGTAKPASELYVRCGFELKDTAIRVPEEGKLHELNVPAFYVRKAAVLSRFTKPTEGLNFYESQMLDAFGLQAARVAVR